MAGSVDEALNIITHGFQSNTKLGEDFLDSIDEYGVVFKSLGLNGAEGINVMNQAMKGGARNGDLVADTLKEFTLLGKEMTTSTADSYKSIGLNSKDMQTALAAGGPAAKAAFEKVTAALRSVKDPVLQNAAAVGIFGTKAEDMQSALYAIDPAAATQGVGDLANKATDFVTNSAGMETQLSSISRNLTDGLAAALTPLLPQLVQLSGIGLEFFKWLGANPAVTQIILGIGAALGIAAAGQWAFNAAQLANPTTWIILAIMAAIALVIGIVILFATHWDEVTKNMAGAGRVLHAALASVWNGIIHGINGVIHGLNGLARGFEAVLSLGGMLGDWHWGEIPTIGLVDVPALATGGTITGSGTTLVGENGPELLNLPHGSSVVPLDHPAAANLAGNSGGSRVVNITTINPVAERTSESTKKAGQYLGAALV
jgi:hypothetical protein